MVSDCCWTTFVELVYLLIQVQGLIISQMLRKSVETRDWVNTIEPRNVRAVMKRVVEDTTSIDVQVMHRTFVSNFIYKKDHLESI